MLTILDWSFKDGNLYLKCIWKFRWYRKVNAFRINHNKIANVVVRVLVHKIYPGGFYAQNIIPFQGTGLKAI